MVTATQKRKQIMPHDLGESRKRVLGPLFPTGDIFYGWWLVGVAAFLLTLMSLTVFQGLGTILVALERQFGWSRTALSGAFSLARVEGAILGPVEGFLVDRIGTRRMVLIGYILMGLGFIWLGQVETLWQFYASFMTISLGSGLGGWLAIIAMVNNWFTRQRSFAMASAMSGIHFGGLLVPLFALGIETFEFRGAATIIGVILLIVVGPAAKIIRNRPEDMGLQPDGDSELLSESVLTEDEEPDFTAGQALKTPVFWILTIMQVASSIAIVTLALHLVPKLTDMGMTLSGAGTVVLTYTIVALPSQFLSGYFADRLPKTLMIAVFLAIQGIAIIIIAFADSVPLAYLFALLYGIGFGGRNPLTTAIRGEYFGRKAFATIMGISQFPMNIGMIGAPLFAGYMFDTTNSYVIPFSVFAILTFFGAFLMLFVKKPQKLNQQL
jgi:MFS family permease|tara:strand:- start:2683 stop:3999 length:1317 start_codon:yes stop_codon:yes gene_type:complete